MQSTELPDVAAENFSLVALFMNADVIVQAVMIMLLVASVWSWAIAIDKWFGIGAVRKRAARLEADFWSGEPLEELAERASDKPADAMARVFSAGSREWRDARRINSASDAQVAALMDRARTQMTVATNREAQRLEQGLATLAIIASSSPFIGLFGTVVGIMNAFRSIAGSRETSLDVVAPGIAEALFATGLGLAAAIPALIFYNKFSGDIGRLTERMENFAQEFAVRLSRRVTERADH